MALFINISRLFTCLLVLFPYLAQGIVYDGTKVSNGGSVIGMLQ